MGQPKARLQSSLSSAGHTVASMRSMAKFSKYAYYQDALHGIAYYNFICQIETELMENADAVVASIKALAEKLFTSDRLLISLTRQCLYLQTICQSLENLSRRMEPVSLNPMPGQLNWQKLTRDLWMHPRYSMWQEPETSQSMVTATQEHSDF